MNDEKLETIIKLNNMSRLAADVSAMKQQIATQTRLLNIPPIYQGKKFSDIKIYSEVSPTYQRETIQRIIKHFSNYRENIKACKNSAFIGNFGNGKSLMAYLVAQCVINQGFRVKLQEFNEIISDVRSNWGKPEIEQKNFLKSYSIPDLLIIDEFKQEVTLDEHKTLSEIFDWRYKHQKPILLIANKKIGVIEEVLGPRLWSRFQENDPEIFVFAWEDFRPVKSKFISQNR